MERYRAEIRKEALRRDLPGLLHFTRIENLASIIDHGIVSRRALDDAGHPYHASDQYRFDGKPEAVSISVSHPNYAMFEAKQRTLPSTDWVVLLLDLAIVWELPCRFCRRNAASKSMAEARGAQAGVWTFRSMFIADDGSDCGDETANNDAEVLVYGAIDPTYVIGAWVERTDLALYVQAHLDRISGEDLPTFVRPFAWPGLRNECDLPIL